MLLPPAANRTLLGAIILLGLALGVFIATGRELRSEGAASSGDTVLQCIQGRCIEIAAENADPLQILTAQQEIERLGRIPPTFEEVSARASVAFQHTRDDNFFNFGGGAAAADFNNDGWLDLYVTNSDGPNALYRNNGNGTFSDVALEAGVLDANGHGHGVAWGDYDNDGWPDLYVANYGTSRLYRNNGDGTFSDVTATTGVGDPDLTYRTTGAVWGDYDGDGNLDLLVVRHIDAVGPLFTIEDTAAIVLLRECRTEEFYANPKVPRGVVVGDSHDFSNTTKRNFDGGVRPLALYHNRGDGTFEDVTALLSDGNHYPSNVAGAGFKPAFVDYDNDGDPDIYVVNDYGYEIYPDVLWRNDGPGPDGAWRFTDVSEGSGVNPPIFGMGLAAGDYDNDGDPDFYVTDIGPSRFFENRDGLFEDVTDRTGTGRGVIPENGEVNLSIGWGATFADLDNDGWLDLYMTNGQIDSDPCSNLPHQPNALFINKADGTFADVSHASLADDPGTSREVVDADFNNDGRLDLYVVNIGSMDGTPGTSHLYLNQETSNNRWLEIAPVYADGDLAVGARVEVTVNGLTLIQDVGQAQGHMSQSLTPVHFGAAQATRVDRILIRWPDGTTQTLESIPTNQRLTIQKQP